MSNSARTGKGLDILIECGPEPINDWMSFAAWFGINRFLPDAHVVLQCQNVDPNREYLRWAYRLRLPIKYRETPFTGLKISPYFMTVREHQSPLIGDIKGDQGSLVDCKNGVGAFVTSDWIDSVRPPFRQASRFRREDSSVNEVKVLRLWEDCFQLFLAM